MNTDVLFRILKVTYLAHYRKKNGANKNLPYSVCFRAEARDFVTACQEFSNTTPENYRLHLVEICPELSGKG